MSQDQVFPPSFGVSTLSLLLEKSPASILADRSRAPYRVPPACSPPGVKQPIWLLTDVLAWLAEHREPAAVAPPPTIPAAPAHGARRRGRPSKVEQAARAAAQAQEGGAV